MAALDRLRQADIEAFGIEASEFPLRRQIGFQAGEAGIAGVQRLRALHAGRTCTRLRRRQNRRLEISVASTVRMR
jgi:hypothetical protein